MHHHALPITFEYLMDQTDSQPKYNQQKLQRLVDLRNAVGLTQLQVQDIMGVKRATIGNWELGYDRPAPKRRPDFIIYLLDRLELRKNIEIFDEVWEDIVVGEWKWSPLTERERQTYVIKSKLSYQPIDSPKIIEESTPFNTIEIPIESKNLSVNPVEVASPLISKDNEPSSWLKPLSQQIYQIAVSLFNLFILLRFLGGIFLWLAWGIFFNPFAWWSLTHVEQIALNYALTSLIMPLLLSLLQPWPNPPKPEDKWKVGGLNVVLTYLSYHLTMLFALLLVFICYIMQLWPWPIWLQFIGLAFVLLTILSLVYQIIEQRIFKYQRYDDVPIVLIWGLITGPFSALMFYLISIWFILPFYGIVTISPSVPPFLPVGTMLPPAIPQLEVVGTLYITPVNATLNESVIGTFTLRNNSNTPIEVAQLRLAGRGPNTNSWSGPEASFPAMTDVTLLPHTEMVYQQSRTFTQTGLYFAEPVMMDLDGNWQTLQPFERFSFEIVDFKYPFWKIDIFNNVNLNGEPFTSSLPVKAIPNDKGGYTLKFEIKDALPTRPLNTSARIYGRFQFDAAEYHFHCEHHDGCRVFVDGQEWIGVWWDGGGGNDLTRPLTEGFHEVMIEFYDKSGWGFLEVWWEKK